MISRDIDRRLLPFIYKIKDAYREGIRHKSLEATVKVVYSPPWHDLTLNPFPPHPLAWPGQQSDEDAVSQPASSTERVCHWSWRRIVSD